MTFLVIPGVDIHEGRCVRLVQGDFARATVFEEDPLVAALRWQEEGAPWLHVVDLDGAAGGAPRNAEAIARIAAACRAPLEVSGGLRTLEQIAAVLALGVQRVVLGTLAVEQPEVLAAACDRWGERIVLGLDSRQGRVATRGWRRTTDLDAVAFARQMVERGVRRIIATDIERDGTLRAPNFSALAGLIAEAGVPVIASGGVSRVEHLLRLCDLGAEGAIIGRALYDGSLRYAEAQAALAGDPVQEASAC